MQQQIDFAMRMFTETAKTLREINDFVNKNAIPQEHIVEIFQSKDGFFMLIYYAEE